MWETPFLCVYVRCACCPVMVGRLWHDSGVGSDDGDEAGEWLLDGPIKPGGWGRGCRGVEGPGVEERRKTEGAVEGPW